MYVIRVNVRTCSFSSDIVSRHTKSYVLFTSSREHAAKRALLGKIGTLLCVDYTARRCFVVWCVGRLTDEFRTALLSARARVIGLLTLHAITLLLPPRGKE